MASEGLSLLRLLFSRSSSSSSSSVPAKASCLPAAAPSVTSLFLCSELDVVPPLSLLLLPSQSLNSNISVSPTCFAETCCPHSHRERRLTHVLRFTYTATPFSIRDHFDGSLDKTKENCAFEPAEDDSNSPRIAMADCS